MKKIALIFGLLPFSALAESDAEIALRNALNTVKAQCGGISESMGELKKMAGVGTAVNAVGTATGVGGVASGVAKWYKDKEIGEALVEKLKLEQEIERLKALEQNQNNYESSNADLENEIEAQVVESVSGIETNTTVIATEETPENAKYEGIVVDENNEPLVGVNIQQVSDRTKGCITDYDGHFSCDTLTNERVKVSYVGYKTAEISLLLSGNHIVLTEAIEGLQDLEAVSNCPTYKLNYPDAAALKYPNATKLSGSSPKNCKVEECEDGYVIQNNRCVKKEESINAKIQELEKQRDELQQKINKSQKDSITAGNVRTGLFVVDTATNVAGAVVSSKTSVNEDLSEKIKKCTDVVESLRSLNTRVRVEDGDKANTALLSKSENILNRCSQYEYVEVVSLNNLAKGAIISNSVGAVTGSAATITSVLGNNKKASDIIVAGDVKKAKEYDALNTSSNVLGGVTAAASLSGTILNASQIKKIKEIVNIAEECESAL